MSAFFFYIGITLLFFWLIRQLNVHSRDLEHLKSKLQNLESKISSLQPKSESRPFAAESVQKDIPPTSAPSVFPVNIPQPPPLPPVLPKTEVVSHSSPTSLEPVFTEAPKIKKPSLPSIDFEQFMGIKLFAWIGGLLIFFGVAFFVKYSFENNFISPELRVAIGYMTGISFLIGGLLFSKKDYSVLSKTLCATATLVLYGVTFGAHTFYHLFSPTVTFLLMILITVATFLLAVRLDAQVVAILGLLGGFLTPLLLSTGKDNPLGLFSYIAILDTGLILVALRKRWNHLTFMAAIGTIIMQVGWAAKFFAVPKVYTAMNVFLGFEVLFLLAFAWAKKRDQIDKWIGSSACLMPFVALLFSFWLMDYPEFGKNPGLIFTFVLAADLGLIALAVMHPSLRQIHLAAGMLIFVQLSTWTVSYSDNSLLNWGLAFYLVFAILHTVFPIVLQKLRPETPVLWWGHLFPPIALVLSIGWILHLPHAPLSLWLGIFLLDLLAIGMAIFTASIFSIAAVLILTLVGAGLCITKIPSELTGLPQLLLLLGSFSVFFFAAGIFAARKIAARLGSASSEMNGKALPKDLMAQIPALSAMLPFVLLIMIVVQLPLGNPSAVFGLALLLVILQLGVARFTKIDWLTSVGLISVFALEAAWHSHRFTHELPFPALGWYLLYFGIFFAYPFIFRKDLQERVIPWGVSALSGPLQFILIYDVVKHSYPALQSYLGILPALFAIPTLLSLIYLVRSIPPENPTRNSQLAWFGGVALFFITLIFPIQFSREWITIGWALEGAALLWLYHRIPHRGLRLVGVALLGIVFFRLAVNPAVWSYHPRSTTPILNWYLYTYGIATACLWIGAKLLAPPRHLIRGLNMMGTLYALGTILAFFLMNIEIADYFSTGSTLTFKFSGNFARDMTYSIAWALFAIGLLIVGMRKSVKEARYASIALLSFTVLKLIFHDFSRLDQLHRIGATIGVAVLLLFASFLFQRFFSQQSSKQPDESNETPS